MKKYILSMLLLCVVSLAQAQTKTFERSYIGGQYLGVEIAFNRPILRYQFADNAHPLSALASVPVAMNGTKLGLVYEASIVKGLGCRFGLEYAIAGNHTTWRSENTASMYPKWREKYWMHEIEIPIDWQYKFTIAKQTYLLLYTGPAFAYQFDYMIIKDTQKLPTSAVVQEITSHYDKDYDNDNKVDYTRFNLTWGVGAGFQYKQYYLRGGYNFGIYNHFRDGVYNKTEDSSYKNNARFDEWNIKLGIYFLNF